MRFASPTTAQRLVSIPVSTISTCINRNHPLAAKFPCKQTRHMASSSDLDLKSTDIKTSSGVTLSAQQQTLVGSVLDLFAGLPTLKKLQLWRDDATFEDNITIAEGRAKYEPQWYGLQSMFSEIERLSHQVTSAGNPITMDLRTRYVIKGIQKETTIESHVEIHYDEEGRITKVADKWGGKMPEGSIATALRELNSKVVPKMVSVPKNEEEDLARQSKQ